MTVTCYSPDVDETDAEALRAAQERVDRAMLELPASTAARDALIVRLADRGIGATAQAVELSAGRQRAYEAAKAEGPRTPDDPSVAELIARRGVRSKALNRVSVQRIVDSYRAARDSIRRGGT